MINKCTVTIALNYRAIQSEQERVLYIKLFINKYEWDRIKYLPKIDD